MKNTSSRVALSFHVPNDRTVGAAILELDNLFEEFFGARGQRVDVLEDVPGEIVYAIRLPLEESDEANREFFKLLQRLLERTKIYNSHFTQVPEKFTLGR